MGSGYVPISSLRNTVGLFSIYGVVTDFSHPVPSRGTDFVVSAHAKTPSVLAV